MLTAVVVALLLSQGPSKPSAVLRGRVMDPASSLIPNATIKVAVPKARPLSVTAGPKGEFEFVLAPGLYEFQVAAPGFDDLVQAVSIAPGENRADFTLAVRRRTEVVEAVAQGEYRTDATETGTRTLTALRDIPQAITVVRQELMRDQLMSSLGDVLRYAPGIQVHQGENNRDQVIIRGQSSSADFFVNGARDDVQYYRDLYNLDRVEALKGPNAMIFGRGGGGGVVNRVTKQADFTSTREVLAQGGSYGEKRVSGDFGRPLTRTVAMRLNAMFEDSGSFRHEVDLRRFGVNPTLTWLAGPATRFTFGYEHLSDRRTADRGITSYRGLPADVDPRTYYGNPADSRVRADVDIASAAFEHRRGSLLIRNRATAGAYDRFYQNYVPGATSADKSTVALSAYSNATARNNLFNQTDFVYSRPGKRASHTVLAGVEFGRQSTDNFRRTGYFNDRQTTLAAPYAAPTISTPVTFRQSATDADNHVRALIAAVTVQDQVILSKYLQLVAGLRFDRFDLDYRNHRDGSVLRRVDDLVSPRAGVVVKPSATLSMYASHTVSYLPSAGDQFSSLTAITEQAKPEKFINREIGIKWDARSALALTAALYRLDRTNTRATDPSDPTRLVQTGSQRTHGVELGVTGTVTPSWRVVGGYAYQDASVTSATIAARLGARVAQVPRHTFSLWNHYQVSRRLGAGVGLSHRSDMSAAIDNTVTLPGYTRLDFAVFYAIGPALRLQANVENAADIRYWANADSNTNISPGRGRSLRVAFVKRF